MTRKKMMAGNWKMNKTIGEAVALAQNISNQYDDRWPDACDVVVCPPFVDLKPAKTVFEFDRVEIAVGAQNVHWEESGAYTGEISVPMLKEIGSQARADIEELLGQKVYLELWVKIRDDWRNDNTIMKQLGYNKRDL